MSKIQSVQLLRGFAAILVVLCHLDGYIQKYYNLNLFFFDFKFGASGVDFFFVLSGFIISYSCSKLINTSELRPYYLKRFFRIFPTYWIIITPLLIFSISFPDAVNKDNNFSIFSLASTYFLLPGHDRIIAVSWTLTYELYFYFLFSLLIFSKKIFPILIIVISLSLLNLISQTPIFSNEKINFLFSEYNIEFALGVLCYFIISKINLKNYPYILLLSGIIFFIFSCTLMEKNYFNRVIFFGIPYFLILISIISIEKNKGLTIPKILILLGDASYIIYLIHYPIISFVNKIGMKTGVISYINPLIFNLFVLLLILIFSIFLYKKVEKPLLDLAYKKET